MADRTKIWIADTLKIMLGRKPLDKIRVSEICREAELDRTTFYYHFRDKYDLMAWMLIRSAYDTDILDIDSSARALDHMRKDLVFFKRAYEDTSQTPMWQYMHEYFVQEYTRLVMAKLRTETIDTPVIYSIRLYCHGTLGMTREWLLSDNVTPAKTAVAMMFDAMPESLKVILFN